VVTIVSRGEHQRGGKTWGGSFLGGEDCHRTDEPHAGAGMQQPSGQDL
jgi:hypothetical protein